MENIKLQVFLKILGIGSASGLVFNGNSLFLIADNSTYLYEYQLNDSVLNKIPLVENAQENIPKKNKPDFESILKKDKEIYVFGSGSTPNRMNYLAYNIETKTIVSYDLSKILGYFSSQFNIQQDELNIEGIVYNNELIYFFQRGNGKNKVNAVFIFHNFGNNKPEFRLITLPKINEVEATFTDAVMVEDKIYFLASAENSNSTYDDGEVMGSLIGILNPITLAVEKTVIISNTQKFEGITLFSNTNEKLEFLLCEDNDTEVLESTIYKMTFPKE